MIILRKSFTRVGREKHVRSYDTEDPRNHSELHKRSSHDSGPGWETLTESSEYVASKTFSGREPVSDEDMKKAETEGVVQRKPNGKWGIISKRKREWWSADYSSKALAEAGLRGYQMNKRG